MSFLSLDNLIFKFSEIRCFVLKSWWEQGMGLGGTVPTVFHMIVLSTNIKWRNLITLLTHYIPPFSESARPQDM